MKKVILSLLFSLFAFVGLYAASSVKDLQERLRWVNLQALKLAMDDLKGKPGFDYDKAQENWRYLADRLEAFRDKGIGSDTIGWCVEAQLLLSKQHAILLDNPLLDVDKILVTRFALGKRARKAMAPALCMPPGNYMGLMDAPKRGYRAEICEISGLRDSFPRSRRIYAPLGSEGIADVQLHWNADKLLFTTSVPVALPGADTLFSWRIFEVGVDGQNLKMVSQVEDPDLEFADPCYLPDGRILLTTNIGYNGIPCEHGLRAIHNLAIYDPASKALRKISFDQDGNWSPTVLNNGKVMYTRWEYTDLTHYFSRIVMTSNPDGTECKALYGSGSYWPNGVFDMQQLPEHGTRFVGIVSGHHGVARSGRLFIFDPAKGRKEEKGVVQEIPYKNKTVVPEIKDYLVDGVWPQFSRPFPLNDKYFLVSTKLHKEALWGIYLVDVFDNVTLIAETEGDGYITPIPVVKRPLPPAIPDRIHPEDKEATVFIQDLYEGEGLQGVPRGTVKKLRIFTYEYAYLNSPSDFDAQGIQSGWDIKRELGTVSVEADGSVIFKVPANTPISIQPLDEKGGAIQWMRSWFTPMPGEVVSCVGCHEDQNRLPIPKRVIASQKEPKPLVPPQGGVRPFTFAYEIQPLLDRYCIGCHDGSNGSVYLKSDQKELYKRGVVTKVERYYHKSYLNLHPYVYRQGPEADIHVLRPYEYHASNSLLIQMLDKGHHGVAMSDTDLATLCQWIDFNAPYSGSFEIWKPYKGYDQYARRRELMKKYGGVEVDWQKELVDYARVMASKAPIETIIPLKSKEEHKIPSVGWGFDQQTAVAMQQKGMDETTKTLEIAPGVSISLAWIPAGSYLKKDESEQKYRKVNLKKGFWMGTMEVSNDQFKAIYPEHDSRYIGQQWKDHTTPGYPANQPQQPVVRVSWNKAVEYCKELSEKTGVQVTLPTEEQWEWAARAGATTDMWYGSISDDYAAYENMADRQIGKLAVTGVDPKPMSAKDPMRKFWDFVPRDTLVDDGSLIAVRTGSYRPNAWGLYDLHGNVAEWTLSSRRGDATRDNSHEMMVCGEIERTLLRLLIDATSFLGRRLTT